MAGIVSCVGALGLAPSLAVAEAPADAPLVCASDTQACKTWFQSLEQSSAEERTRAYVGLAAAATLPCDVRTRAYRALAEGQRQDRRELASAILLDGSQLCVDLVREVLADIAPDLTPDERYGLVRLGSDSEAEARVRLASAEALIIANYGKSAQEAELWSGLLQSFLLDENEVLRGFALRTLVQHPDAQDPALTSLLTSLGSVLEKPEDRVVVYRLLKRDADPSMLAELVHTAVLSERISHPAFHEALVLFTALAGEDTWSVRVLKTLLSKHGYSSYDKRLLIRAAVSIGDPSLQPFLLAMKRRSDAGISRHIDTALTYLGSSADEREAILPRLSELEVKVKRTREAKPSRGHRPGVGRARSEG